MAPTLFASLSGETRPSLTNPKGRATLSTKRVKVFIGFVLVLGLFAVKSEWAWIRPRLRPFQSSRTPDDVYLDMQLASAEDKYQASLRQRKELIHRFGPTPADVLPFPRNYDLYTMWDFFTPAFNCPHIVERIGILGDGGKYVCGIDRLANKKDCVIYSFGINGESSFEAGLLDRTKHCKIYGYDFSTHSFGPEVTSIDRWKWRTQFRPYGLSGKDAHGPKDPWPPMYSLSTLMYENGHTFIDLLKIDIEGWEFPTLTAFLEAYAGLPLPFGQLQLEIHASDMPFENFLKWWEALESAGLRPFWTEPNLVYVNINKPTLPDLAEYSFLNIRGQNAFTSNEGII